MRLGARLLGETREDANMQRRVRGPIAHNEVPFSYGPLWIRGSK